MGGGLTKNGYAVIFFLRACWCLALQELRSVYLAWPELAPERQ